MMDREWAAILARYGQNVSVYTDTDPSAARTKAFLQPILERGQQMVPSPLGQRREERYLYLGAPEVPLTAGESLVDWAGRTFEVWSARSVYAGQSLSHWWAVLRPREPEVQV